MNIFIGVSLKYSSLGTISNSSSGIDWNKIEQWIEEWKPDKFIIGKTKKADGSKSDLDEAINIFAKKLRKKNIPVDYVDEARSSIEAREILKIKRRIGSNKKIKIQKIIAKLLELNIIFMVVFLIMILK